MPKTLIGILEDERPQAELTQEWLLQEGYEAFYATNEADFLSRVEQDSPDGLILDWQLPDCEGIDVLLRLRESLGFSGPILFATGRDSEEDVVRGLTSGADDYLIKPLRKLEFQARLQAVLRRMTGERESVIELGPIRIDTANKQVTLNGEELELTPTEYRLAECLCSNVGVLLSRDHLLNTVWNVSAELDTRKVDVYVSRLRRKLRIEPSMGYCVRTVYRHGYRLEQL